MLDAKIHILNYILNYVNNMSPSSTQVFINKMQNLYLYCGSKFWLLGL